MRYVQLARFVRLEEDMYSEKSSRNDELILLRERTRSMERELEAVHQNVDAVVAEKFKLAQSNSSLNRIHLLDDMKCQLDSALSDLKVERSRVVQLKENEQSLSLRQQGEMARERRMEYGFGSLIRLLDAESSLDTSRSSVASSATLRKLDDNTIRDCVDRVRLLLFRNRTLSEKSVP